MTVRGTFLSVCAVVALVTPAAAQIALYEGRLPEGFAYVRFANTTPDPIELMPTFTDQVRLGTDGAARISQYRVVESAVGRTLNTTTKDGGHFSFQLTAGRFHTFLVAAGGAQLAGTLITDVTEYNQQRSKLSFYNTAPGCPTASLLLEPTNKAVFEGIQTATMRTRSINPVAEAKVHALCGTVPVPTLDLGELNAGALYSVWLMAPGGTPFTFLAQDFIAPYQR